MYAEVTDGVVVEVWHVLPAAWRNISGFDLLDQQQLADLAWAGHVGTRFVPVVEEPQPVLSKCCYAVTGPSYTFDAVDAVVRQSWTVTQRPDLDAWDCLRAQRNSKLRMTDWTQLPDSPLTVQKKTEYAQYRQALRDITSQSDPRSVVWPVEPAT